MDAAPKLSPSTAFLVRWESAVTVGQAFARLNELGEHAAAAFEAPSPRIPADRYVVTVKLEQAGRSGFEPFAVTPAGRPELRATLKTRQGSVAPAEVEFTGTGANSSVHFFFPMEAGGVPLVPDGHDAVDFTLVGVDFSVHSKFRVNP